MSVAERLPCKWHAEHVVCSRSSVLNAGKYATYRSKSTATKSKVAVTELSAPVHPERMSSVLNGTLVHNIQMARCSLRLVNGMMLDDP